MTLTQEALAAADRHQAGRSAATAAFCLWKGNCFLVASIVERLQRRHFEHKWHYSNSRNLRRLFWKFRLDKSQKQKSKNNILILYIYNIIYKRFADLPLNWCQLLFFCFLSKDFKLHPRSHAAAQDEIARLRGLLGQRPRGVLGRFQVQ